MIDKHGYPKLIDFGFAKVRFFCSRAERMARVLVLIQIFYIGSNQYITEKTFTLCGTPGYLPPEIGKFLLVCLSRRRGPYF